ncbi:MAG TPA: hypothetical protein VFP84_29635, partial [Kofleriaceae bacterium]|nr:hypothetical protein [Kofleriaceae bacterium]
VVLGGLIKIYPFTLGIPMLGMKKWKAVLGALMTNCTAGGRGSSLAGARSRITRGPGSSLAGERSRITRGSSSSNASRTRRKPSGSRSGGNLRS